ncbi:hypothetical protein [Methylobacterium sp. V23]|uniref:hypothetical protein n=1 Tax=Methylobacterium sp. V23 TaxID=2044878 RepID=UPI000CDB6C2A|nr:hypothetical protein [Methylobacterium sp. V23]POR41322.1 hypothetical protein CRT23_19405 [Methylobacterium sp. V23]
MPVDCSLSFRLDVWLTYRPDVDRIPRVRTAIDWLRACFDVRLFPFFGKDRIHPRDMASMENYVALSDLFKGFVR